MKTFQFNLNTDSLFYAWELQCQINKKQISCDLFQNDSAETISKIYT